MKFEAELSRDLDVAFKVTNEGGEFSVEVQGKVYTGTKESIIYQISQREQEMRIYPLM